MKTKSVVVEVAYVFRVRYEHEEHLENILRDLREYPLTKMSGAGIASDGKVYGFGCDMEEQGRVLLLGTPRG